MHKIIDCHSHLGDIFASEKNVVYKGDVPIDPSQHDPFASYSEGGFKGAFLDPDNPEQVKNVIDMTAAVSYANTLSKLSRDLDESHVDYVCLYPVAPFITFEDYRVAALVEPRIIPFTSADWRIEDGRAIGSQLLADAARGARGLKIHPILQNVSLRDPRVEEAVALWAETGLPVVSHCGVNSYYPDDSPEAATQNPAYGNLEDFMYLVERLPQVKFIAAHAGGLTGGRRNIAAHLGVPRTSGWTRPSARPRRCACSSGCSARTACSSASTAPSEAPRLPSRPPSGLREGHGTVREGHVPCMATQLIGMA